MAQILTLYVLAGEPGVGKTAVARELSDTCDADHYDSDRIRKAHVVDEMGRDAPQYDSEESQRTYDELHRRARHSLQNGRSAVLDATFNLKRGRDNAAALADELDVPLQILRVTCDDEVARERIRERAESDSVSDADIEVYEKIKLGFEDLERPHTVIDNSGTLEETRRQIHEQVVHQ